MNEGFYKLTDVLNYAPNAVFNKDYELIKEQHLTYNYPVDGWYWFDTLEEACNFFDLNIADYQLPQEEPIIE